mmetsp:Transcript_26914/g.41023  ORF Transcript_26914/g.41023 Transcript_26914/m.41023 type:complete len:117 (+) Transcript_26914:3320-3670(+)
MEQVVDNSPENLDNIILEFPFQEPNSNSGNFQMVGNRQRAFQGDSFSVKRKEPPPSNVPPQDKIQEQINMNASAGFLFGSHAKNGDESLQPSPIRTEPAIPMDQMTSKHHTIRSIQ